ncbi:MAG: hypothetical protein IKC83_03605 [Clostridia bacterium]|nr:hypothetical protein [Clostridia bacterium]
MKFFHVYNEDCYKGLEKNGLLNKDTGFKIQHAFSVPERLKFNEFAKTGSTLYNIIKENKIPFYVDRIAGGVTWHNYNFDKNLIDEYKSILGDWFLGFQLHESGSNRRRAEWPRTIKVMNGQKGPFDLEELKAKTLLPANKMPGHKIYNFSQDSVEYFSTLRYSETYSGFEKEMRELFNRRMMDTNGNILPCDSYFLATKLQNDMGMRTFMPEVGCQIPLMRLAVALARGMATVNNKTWGAYYECWREIKDVGYCMPCFNREPINEWYLRQEQHGDDFSTYGENGGSSRLLQNRIYYHALMSGADYFAEEWGLNCSYTDMRDFTLSKYGQIKKDFINQALEMGKIKAKIPFAIVIPSKYSCIELPDIFTSWNIGEHKTTYMEGPLTKDEIAYFGHVEDVLKLIFARVENCGNEGHVLTNSRFGDLFDIIYDDTTLDGLKNYEYLIDATQNNEFIKAKSNQSLNILSSANLDELSIAINNLTKKIMPCFVYGLPWIVSTDENGKNMLSIFNNEGNERDLVKGDIIHHQADKKITITFKESTNLRILKSLSNINIEKIDDVTYNVIIPATELAIFEF